MSDIYFIDYQAATSGSVDLLHKYEYETGIGKQTSDSFQAQIESEF